ncbi:molybdopterin-dependent oxidoreductase [Corynebacterium sp. 3HC-13]|nr:molybdopterin-dependent oxidoreductase [Corynebacterium poyangense]
MQDMANADCIVIQGSNMAECHPVGFQWVMEAKKRGARIIHVDPRFTRTSAVAHRHISIRGGTDVVLLGALIRYVIENDKWFHDYVVNYTNAAMIINDHFEDTEDLDGLFSGYDPETGKYDNESWGYERSHNAEEGAPSWHVECDDTLQHPRSVFQILRRHYQRYTTEMVETVCGISSEDFHYLAESICANSNRERTTCFAYALGWTQHTLGAQFIRTCAILQLLLGNVGRPGSGIMALRGHASIQGSTDIPTLFHLLPGYLPMPAVTEQNWEEYLDKIASADQKGFWQRRDAYAVSLMKAYWGENATAENNWGLDFMPRLSGAHSTYHTLQAMMRDEVDGYLVFGQNPAVAQSHGRLQRLGLSHLKWMVVRDFQEMETATFWKDSPEVKTGELKTEDIQTEVFLMPAATHVEKCGTFTQTQRMVQWRFQALHPPGDATSELQFFYELGRRIKEKIQDSDDPRDLPLKYLTWDYPVNEHGDPDADAVLKEINGYHLSGEKAGELLSNFGEMKADGSTSGGCWIYAGVYAGGVNHAAKKTPGQEQNELAMDWGWVWPANRRLLYNRASADPDGKPWSERKKYIWWDEDAGRWVGDDVPDFPPTLAPSHQPDPEAVGPAALSGNDAFIMQPDGKGWLFAPTGMVDGPLPTHYEPHESPVPNLLYHQQQSPTRLIFKSVDNLSAPNAGEPGSEVYPYLFNTYRLTEMYTSGAMTRTLPYLAELQPELFCEVSPKLADQLGLEHGGWATIISPRSAIEARVLITDRIEMLTVNGKDFHQIGLPYHYGQSDAVGEVRGDSPNDLLGITLDPNVNIQASKVSACAVVAGRRPRGAERTALVKEYQRRAGLTPDTGNVRVTASEKAEAESASAVGGHNAQSVTPRGSQATPSTESHHVEGGPAGQRPQDPTKKEE